MESGDAAEWGRARAGDQAALGVLFDRYYSRIFRHCNRFALQPADADDITAATFFELWRRRDSVELHQGSLLPWLYVTSANLARNALRRRIRYGQLIARLPRDPEWHDPATEVEQRLDAAARRRRLVRALRGLSANEATLVIVVDIDGMPIVDAAGVMGLKPATARSLLARARKKLRNDLADLAPTAS